MKREHFASFILIAAALSFLAAAWITSSPNFWPALFSAIVAPVFAVLLTKWMKKLQDERFNEIYNLSARNAFTFLLFALPFIPAIFALQSIAVEAVGLILGLIILAWAISMAIFYASGIYYYKH